MSAKPDAVQPDAAEPPLEEASVLGRPPELSAPPRWPDRSHFSEFDLAIEGLLKQRESDEAAPPSEAPSA